MNPSSLMSLSSRVVLRHVYYVDELNQTIVNHSGLIPIEDIKKLQRSKYLSEECGDEYFMKYLLDNPIRGILFAARYGVLSLFELCKGYYIHPYVRRRRIHKDDIVCLPYAIETASNLFANHFEQCLYIIAENTNCSRSFRNYISTSCFGKQFWHYEHPHDNKGLPLSTVAAIGGNLDIVKQVCSIENLYGLYEYDEMMMYAVIHGRVDVVNYCFKQCTFTDSFLIELIEKAMAANVMTKMLMTLFNRSEKALWYRSCFSHVPYMNLLIEFGFRRAINYHPMIFPEEFENVDLSCVRKKNNKLFTYALYNNVFIRRDDRITHDDYSLAFAAVCISKKASIDLLYKLENNLLRATSWSCNVRLKILGNALNYVIDSTTQSLCV